MSQFPHRIDGRVILVAIVFSALVFISPPLSARYDKDARGAIIVTKDQRLKEGVLIARQKSHGQFEWTFQDEAGEVFVLRDDEMESVLWKDPEWLAEEKWQSDYEKLSKDADLATWEKNAELAQWCSARNLTAQWATQMEMAHDKRLKAMPATAEGNWEMSEWCRVNGLSVTAEDHRQRAYDLVKGDEPSLTADCYVKTARWCREKGLRDWAQRDYETALEIMATCEAAKQELAAMRAEERALLAQWRDTLTKERRVWQIKMTIQFDCDDDYLAQWEIKLRMAADLLWMVTEGQFYFDAISLCDNAQNGNVILTAEEREKGGGHTDGTISFVGGLAGGTTVLHELFHGKFFLPDEYPPHGNCPCIMGVGPWLCDKVSHNGTGPSCWEMVSQAYHAARHPNPDWEWLVNDGPMLGAAGQLHLGPLRLVQPPACKLTVTNTEPGGHHK